MGAEDSCLSMEDLNADIDASSIHRIYKLNRPIYSCLIEYYSKEYVDRYSNSILNKDRENLFNYAHVYTKRKFLSIVEWPLYEEYELKENQLTALESELIADEFTDFIITLIWEEK